MRRKVFTGKFPPVKLSPVTHRYRVGGAFNSIFKIPKSLFDHWRIISLKTLLDAYPDNYRNGNNLGAAYESPAFALAPAGKDMVDNDLSLKRKKRRGLRLRFKCGWKLGVSKWTNLFASRLNQFRLAFCFSS